MPRSHLSSLATAVRYTGAVAIAESVERRVLLSGTFDGLHFLGGADFDGDGAGDSVVFGTRRQLRRAGIIVVGGSFRRGGLVVIDGAGGLFSDALPTRGGIPRVVVADFTSDGNPDLVVGGRRATLELFVGEGDGTFADPVPVEAAPAGAVPLAAADFNNDGRQDLVVSARSTTVNPLGVRDTAEFLFGAGMFSDMVSAPAFAGGVTAEGGGGRVGLHGTSAAARNAAVGVTAEAGGAVADPGLLLPDLLPGTRDRSEVLVLLGNGDGTFQEPVPIIGDGDSDGESA